MTTLQRRTRKAAPAKPKLDMGAIAKAFAAFRQAKNTAAEAGQEANQLRDSVLMPALIEHGHAHGDKGVHLAIDLEEEIDGYVRLVRRANTSRVLDIDAAEALLEKKGILPQCQQATVILTGVPAENLEELQKALDKAKLDSFGNLAVDVQFSQDRMMAYHQLHRDKLTEKELDSLIIEETTYSFFPERR